MLLSKLPWGSDPHREVVWRRQPSDERYGHAAFMPWAICAALSSPLYCDNLSLAILETLTTKSVAHSPTPPKQDQQAALSISFPTKPPEHQERAQLARQRHYRISAQRRES